MLTLASLELARAVRRDRPLLSVRTHSLEVVAAAVQAAQLQRMPLLISLDATTPTTVPHRTLLYAALQLGRDASVSVGVEAIIHPDRHAAAWWLSNGVLALTLSGFAEDLRRVVKPVSLEARAHGAELGIELLSGCTVAEAEILGTSFSPTFFRLPPRDTTTEMDAYVKALRAPVIAGNIHLTPKKSKEIVRAGCAGVTLGEELHEAFTGGVRTGIRSRAVVDPAKYLSYGGVAVRELVRTYASYFHS